MVAKRTDLIPAVVYYRMSTDKQDASIPAQRGEVEAYAARHGFKIIREYIDEGISGDNTEKRAAFIKLRDDAQTVGDFKVVLCWDQDRFGRFHSLEAGYWIHPLMKAGVRLVTVAQGPIDWNDFTGRLMYTIQQEGKYQFLRDLSRNVTRSMLARAREGKRNGAKAPYGYSKHGAELVLADDDRPDVVRRIFKMIVEQQKSLGGVTFALNEANVPSPAGKRWCVPGVAAIITNPVYCGRLVWNRKHRGKYHGIRSGEITSMQRGRADTAQLNAMDGWIEGNCPAIVTREVWDRAQVILGERSQTGRRPRDKYLFSGAVCCGHCGHPMDGGSLIRGRGASRGPTKLYRCRGGSQRLCNCKTYVMHEDELAEAVARKLGEFINAPGNLKKLESKIMAKLAERQTDKPSEIERMRRELQGLERKLDSATERLLIVPASVVAELSSKVEAMQRQRDELRRRIAEQERVAVDNDQERLTGLAMAELRNIGKHLRKGGDAARTAMRRCIGEIRLWFEGYVPANKRICYRPLRGEIRLKSPNSRQNESTACRLSSSVLP